MSDWSDVCHGVLEDLTENVGGLIGIATHHCVPWDPEGLVDDGSRHLAVWPSPEGENAEPFTTLGENYTAQFLVAYWEPSGEEDQTQLADPDAAESLLELHNTTRARFLRRTLNTTGGSWSLRYRGVRFPDATGLTRWFLLMFETQRAKDLI